MTNDLTPDQYKREYERRMTANLNELVKRKFGTERGALSKAADALGITPGNFSNMTKGRLKVSQEHLDTLSTLPDYVLAPLPEITKAFVPTPDGYQLTIDLDFDTYETLEKFCVEVTGSKSVSLANLSPDNAAKLITWLVDTAEQANTPLDALKSKIDPLG